jgi:hypothetical protein
MDVWGGFSFFARGISCVSTVRYVAAANPGWPPALSRYQLGNTRLGKLPAAKCQAAALRVPVPRAVQ